MAIHHARIYTDYGLCSPVRDCRYSRSARVREMVRDIGSCLNIQRLRPPVIGLAVISEVIAKKGPAVYRIVGEEHGVLGSRRVDGPAAEAGDE